MHILTVNPILFCFLELQEVLESINLNSIKKAISVLDSCVYDSLLIIVVQDYSQRSPQAFLFQCEESGVRNILCCILQSLHHLSMSRSVSSKVINVAYLIVLRFVDRTDSFRFYTAVGVEFHSISILGTTFLHFCFTRLRMY